MWKKGKREEEINERKLNQHRPDEEKKGREGK